MRSPSLRALLAGALLGTAALAAASCKKKPPASIEELFTARMSGLDHLQRDELPEAEEQFKKLVDLAPDEPLGHANLGLTYLRMGRFKDAEQELDRARKLDPGNVDVALMEAKLYSLTNRRDEARTLLEATQKNGSRDPHVPYALAELAASDTTPAGMARRIDELRDAIGLAPANPALHLQMAAALVRAGRADSAVQQLEEVRRIPPAPPAQAGSLIDSTIAMLRTRPVAEARAPLSRLTRLMEVTGPYQAGLEQVRWIEGPLVGRPVLTFQPQELIKVRGVRQAATVDSVRFVDLAAENGLGNAHATGGAPAPTALALGDVDGDGIDDLFASFWSASEGKMVARLYHVQGAQFRDVTTRSGIALEGGATFATFADYDNDGWLDLYAIGPTGAHLYRNLGNGKFEDVTAKAGIGDPKGATSATWVDLDHDGDLDLLMVGANGTTVYRNNLDGTFTDVTKQFGLVVSGRARDVAFGDFDGDGRIDVIVARDGAAPVLFHNNGSVSPRFTDATAASGLGAAAAAAAIAVGDYDNDGSLDVLIAGDAGATLWRNKGGGTFVRDPRSDAALRVIRGTPSAARFVDYDNDGWVDLLVTTAASSGATAGSYLFRNDHGRLVDRSALVPETLRAVGATAIGIADIDGDGDEDAFVADANGIIHPLRNEGGNDNLAARVELKGLRDGQGKNNDFGIGARVELRAGDLYETRVVTSRVTHFGLGPHLKADVVRIEWPNGVPQTVYFPGGDQDVVEREALKGSCAFAYAWDGKAFRFVTDVMWRSALGMPMGLMANGGGAFAPAGASTEYLRIPGSALVPRDGKYVLQLTEELWETAYADQVRLVAVDHPDSVDVFVDERFVPPGPLSLRLYNVAHREPPRSAVDEHGNDVLPALLAADSVYVSDFTPTRYQGVVEPHDLVMDLGPDAGAPETYLFLRGWIYPTDASINVALAQQKILAPAPPSLEVRDASGKWKTVIPSIGFPSGKDKTMVIDLAGKFPTRDHHVRLRTAMQIYWDQAYVARDEARSDVKLTTLEPTSANLHFRGYSRTYRKGGRYGPYWFDYAQVSSEAPWRPIGGKLTRFGDVLPLLRAPDDMYVVMGPGDETTLEFDASSAAGLPRGWRRDFLLYTDGWIKDSDLNTAYGTTVEPLPYHAMTAYPYPRGERYPTDSVHARYLREYQTRGARAAGTGDGRRGRSE